MVNKAELLNWVQSLDDDSSIGIDEGGLCLREVLADDTMGEAYFEIGGIPEEIENGEQARDSCQEEARSRGLTAL